MKTKILFIINFFILFGALHAQEVQTINPFNQLSVSSGIKVEFTQENTYSLRVQADEKVIGNIITEVQDGILIIENEKGIKKNKNEETVVYVTAPSLSNIKVTNMAAFNSRKLVCDKSFNLDVSSGGDAKIDDLSAKDSIQVKLTGGADCMIRKLVTKKCSFVNEKSGDLMVLNLQAEEAVLNSYKGSDARLKGNVRLITINDYGGDVNITGLEHKIKTFNQMK